MNPQIEKNGETLVVRVIGDFDLSVSDSYRQGIDQQLKAEAVRHLIFDLSAVSFIDSSGLGVILGRYRRVSERGGRVAICGVEPRLGRILEVSGLTKLMSVFPTAKAALEGLSQRGGWSN